MGAELLNWVIHKTSAAFQRFRRITPPETTATRFVDLAPTAYAENAEVYFEALDFGTNNERVLNIALTGPYGSGKSSVIKTYLKRYSGVPLQLSLASFLQDDEPPGKVSKQEIERSILQQILYGVDAHKLPFSRFKRIKAPKRITIGTSLLVTLGLACAWYLFTRRDELKSGALFDPFEFSNWFNYLCILAVGALAWKTVHGIYTNSLGLSLKSISLKDVQIAPAATDQESILNRHLDEILYFFQSTNYDLVVIEDLDRFENPDIFVTLREINGLINANEGVKRRVRFLYALRDDIFANTDRTKFFEFIVPVIPVINHSNSIDKVLEQGQRIDLDARLNKQFVREVSRYLSDLRLIRNIFNEYVVYSTNLATDQDGLLDPNKLLAVLIYKNVLPHDFAALHRQEGVLSQVLAGYQQYISKVEVRIKNDISAIEAELQLGETQALRDQSELRKVYAMAIVERMPANHCVINIANSQIQLTQIAEGDNLEKLLAQRRVNVSALTRYGNPTAIDISDVEDTVDPNRSLEERKADLELKSARFRQKSEKRIKELTAQLSTIRTRRFNEVVRESADLIEQLFAGVGENQDLLKYLILEGHLDDTYYQYISLFHSGRLSPSDNSFLIKIRAYNNPSPDFPLDNVAEVVASMRPTDFGQAYVLNRFIIDYLFSDAAANATRIANVMRFISANFSASEEFFRSYYATGSRVPEFIETLVEKWPSFASVTLDEADGAPHAARILAHTSDRVLLASANTGPLKLFLSENAHQVLAEPVDIDIARFRSLSVEIVAVGTLAEFPKARSFVAQEGLYRLSIENIRHILGHVVRWPDMDALESQHLTTLRAANDAALLKRIAADFPAYVRDVLLALPTNTDEDVSAISSVLAREDVDYDARVEFLNRQTSKFPNLEDIPVAFHKLVMEGQHVEPTWSNCLHYIGSEAHDADILTSYLQEDEVVAALASQSIPDGDAAKPLRQFVIGNDAIDLGIYRSYVRMLPKPFKAFPSVNEARIKVLIEERRVVFAPTSFQELEDVDLQVLFLSMNFAAYEAGKAEYAIDDDFRAKLLRRVSEAQKLDVLADIEEEYVAGTPQVAAIVGPLLDRTPAAKMDHSVGFIKAVIVNSRDVNVQISLLNKLHPSLSVPDVREVLAHLPSPYQDIATFGKFPKIEDNERNRKLAQWLDDRNVISSFKRSLFGGEIRINTFKKEGS
jgi:hypothetical protein